MLGKQAALRKLVELNQRQPGIPVQDIPMPVYVALLHHFGGIRRARYSAGLPDIPHPHKWTQADVIAEIKRVHREGVRIRYQDLEEAGRGDLVGAIGKHIGSIVRARNLARVPHPPYLLVGERESWDEDRVLEEILDRAATGQPLASSRVRNRLINAARRYFGAWQAAIEAADLDYAAIRMVRAPYDDDEILDTLRDLARRRPRMTLAEVAKHKIGCVISNRRWKLTDTIERAGLTKWPVRVSQDVMSKPELGRALRARHRAEKKLTMTAIRRDDSPLETAIRRHYASLEAALTDVGLASELVRTKWTRARVLRELKQRRDLGLSLSPRAVEMECSSLYRTAIRLFGSYWGAATRFGAQRKIRRWTKEVVLTELQRHARREPMLKTASMPNPLRIACQRHFGGLAKARAAAGLG